MHSLLLSIAGADHSLHHKLLSLLFAQYNYRVVMAKGTTELDMRGRCVSFGGSLKNFLPSLPLPLT